MSAIAYLNFDGIAEKAIEFYSEALNANEVKSEIQGFSAGSKLSIARKRIKYDHGVFNRICRRETHDVGYFAFHEGGNGRVGKRK